MRKKIRITKQMENSECGLACLLMLMSYYGRVIQLTTFREKYPCPRGGFSLYELHKISELEGFTSRAYQVSLENIPKSSLPCILHYRKGHFIVLEKTSKNSFTVIDPNSNRKKMSFNELNNQYSGVMLSISPNENFKKKIEKNKNIFRDYLNLSKNKLIKVVITSILFQFIMLNIPVITKSIIDNLNIIDRSQWNDFMLSTLFLFFGYISIDILRGKMVVNAELMIDKSIMTDFMKKILKLPYSFFLNRSNSDILMRANSGTIIRDILTSNLITLIIDLFMMISYFILLSYYSLKLSIILLVICSLLMIIILASSRMVKNFVDQNMSDRLKVQQILYEIVYNIIDLKTLGDEEHFFKEWKSNYKAELTSNKKVNLFQIISGSFIGAIRFIMPLVILLYGVLLVKENEITLGVLLAFSSVSSAFVNPIISVGQNVSSIISLDIYFKRLEDVLNSKTEKVSLNSDSKKIKINEIKFENVAFRFNQFGENILENLNFTIKKGESIGIVGASGSGKSTLLKLLLGLYKPSKGSIYINGINLNDFDLRALRLSIGSVLQESKLFSGTIGENILMHREVSFDTLIDACQKAEILDDINKTPLKFNTMVSEQGMNFSGGQKQRILLARALVNSPSLLVLDESTSNLDNIVEEKIFSNISEQKGMKLIVAHRLSTIKNVQKIFFISDNTIKETGNHESLMNLQGEYYQLYSNEIELNKTKRNIAN